MNTVAVPFGEGISRPAGTSDAAGQRVGVGRSGQSANMKRLEARIRGMAGKAIAHWLFDLESLS